MLCSAAAAKVQVLASRPTPAEREKVNTFKVCPLNSRKANTTMKDLHTTH